MRDGGTPGRPAAADRAADRGEADPELQAALSHGELARIRAAFARARVFVPVVATLTSAGADGGEKESEMSLLLLTQPGTGHVAGDPGRPATATTAATRPAGGSALAAFTSVESLAAWDAGRAAGARPVAVAGVDVARYAADEGCAAIVIDVAGPHAAVLDMIPEPVTYRPASWTPSARLARTLRRCGASEIYLLDIAVGRDRPPAPAIGLVLPPDRNPERVVARLSKGLDRPVDVALLDPVQRELVREAGVAPLR